MSRPASPPKPDSPDKRLDRIRVVLSRPRHPGNIGAAARAVKTMGLSRLALVAPENFPHPKAFARSAGAEDILDGVEIFTSLDEALNGAIFTLAISARCRNLGPEALTANDAADEAISIAESGDVALVFGNETSGLSNEDARRCQRIVHIPANPDYSSLNLGAAVQVLCYELRCTAFRNIPKGEEKAKTAASLIAPDEDIERFYAHLESVMTMTGFLDPARPGRLMPKLRRLFSRVRVERDEINILRGILDAVEKKIGR